MDDNMLMLQVRNGNKQAFETLMKRHMSGAVSFANKYVHDSYTAEDIAQESFADIYIQRYEFNQQYKFSTYLYAIIKNKSLNYLKKHRELLINSTDEYMEAFIEEKRFVNYVTPETEFFKNEGCLELLDEMDKLKEDEKTMLYLYAVDERSYKEIAERLGKTVAQVKTGIFRARKKIRKGRGYNER